MKTSEIRYGNSEIIGLFVDCLVCHKCSINPSCLDITVLLTILAHPCLWTDVNVVKGAELEEDKAWEGVGFQMSLLSSLPVS